jgi:RNA polymerase sigma factor (sigma-70 family)
LRTVYHRTDEELIKDISGFLTELFDKFLYTNSVLFYILQIQKTADKYHIRGRIHRIIIHNEFTLDRRKYTRKYIEFPNNEVILSYVQESRGIRIEEYKRHINKLTPKEWEKYWKERRLRYRSKPVSEEKRLLINKKTYEYKVNKLQNMSPEDRHLFYKREYDNLQKRKQKYLHVFNMELKKALPKLRKYCRGLNCNNYEELVSETLLVAWEQHKKYRIGTNILTWLVNIAIKKNLVHLKKRRFSKEVLVDDFYFDDQFKQTLVSLFEPELDHVIEYKENERKKREELIIRCLNELPMNYRQYITLFSEGKSHVEIAELMGVKPTYSKTRLYMARSILSKKIKEEMEIVIRSCNGKEK